MRKGSISKFLKRIISTALALSVATVPVLSVAPTLNVYADSEYIGGVGGAAGGGNKTYTDGVSQNKTGLLYTFNSKGKIDIQIHKMYIKTEVINYEEKCFYYNCVHASFMCLWKRRSSCRATG